MYILYGSQMTPVSWDNRYVGTASQLMDTDVRGCHVTSTYITRHVTSNHFQEHQTLYSIIGLGLGTSY